MLEYLGVGALRVLGQSISVLECVAFVTGVMSVWLTLRLDIRTWPAGLISVCCYALVFFGAKLYADAILQLAFFITGLYGWWQWAHAGSVNWKHRPVLRATERELLSGAGVSALCIVAIAQALERFTDSPAPLADASVFVLSLFATVLQALRRIEGWWVWIVVDLISIPLYWSRSLYLTALLYCVFLVLCVGGWNSWRSKLHAAEVPA